MYVCGDSEVTNRSGWALEEHMNPDPADLYLSQEVSALQRPDGGFTLSRLDLTGSPVQYIRGIDPRATTKAEALVAALEAAPPRTLEGS